MQIEKLISVPKIPMSELMLQNQSRMSYARHYDMYKLWCHKLALKCECPEGILLNRGYVLQPQINHGWKNTSLASGSPHDASRVMHVCDVPRVGLNQHIVIGIGWTQYIQRPR